MLQPTWRPREMAAWTRPGGPLHGVGTLDDLFGGPGDAGPTLVDGDRRWNAPELADLVAARAAGLRDSGVGTEDVVAWQLANSVDAVVLYRACWSLGAVAAPIHHLGGPRDLERLVDSLSPSVLVTSRGTTVDPAGRRRATGPASSSAGRSTARGSHEGPHEDSIAVVLHTAGSGGGPKGVLHTHRALTHKARSMARLHGLGARDVVLMPAPLAHVSGLLNGILVPAAAQMTTVLMARWSPAAALELIESEHVSFMVGPPTFFISLEQEQGFDPSRVASLRLASVGGAGVTPEFVEHTATTMGTEVKRSYGSTEAPTVTTSRRGDDTSTRSHTDGRPVGAVRIRTVDPVSGAPTPSDEAGELLVSGPELFCGYVDADLTARRTVGDSDGDWFRTGDLAVIDSEGRLRITGRMGDVIIRGGENIDALEVEAHLVEHPAVALAVVVGEPDDRLGERVCAFVELGRGSGPGGFDLATCRDWFHSRGVARYRTPERVVVLDSLPLLASGKADRSRLSAIAAELP